MKIKKIVILSLVLLIGIALFYVWYGFLLLDPYYLRNRGFSTMFKYVWIPRIFIPLLYGLFVTLVVNKNRKITQNITILISSLFVFGIVAYPILDIRYSMKTKTTNKTILKQYHPYLQLKPPSIDQLDRTTKKKTFNIFCIGGSTTEFKNSKGIGWPEMLEEQLQRIYKCDTIKVYNFGMQQYTTLHSLINYEVNLRPFKPDIIILMHNINDFSENADFSYFSNGPFRQDYGHYLGPSKNVFKSNGLFGKFWTNLGHFWYYKPRISFEQDSFPGLESFARNINTLIDLAMLDCTKIILMSQPNIYSKNMEDQQIKSVCYMVNDNAVGKNKRWGFKTVYKGLTLYNNEIKKISKSREVFFVDLEKNVPKSLTYLFDDVHYTDTTYNIISKAIAIEIVEQKIIK